MANSYLDINSDYRDRNLWPIPGEFEVLISQTGLKTKGNAIDPVSLAEPISVWSCNALTTSQPTTFQVVGIIAPQQGYGNIGFSQAGTHFTIVFNDTYNNKIQQITDYFVGLVFWNVTKNNFTRIENFRYIGNSQTVPNTYSIALITVSDSITFSFGDDFIITDDSDLSRSDYPLLFVPNGKNQDNAYLNYYLYCETNNDYRKITFYDSIYRIISCEPWPIISSNPIYQEFGNFCIRKEVPLFPIQLEHSQNVFPHDSTATQITVKILPATTWSLQKFIIPYNTAIKDNIPIPYRYDFLRLRPYRDSINVLPRIFIGGVKKGNELVPSSIQTIIQSYDGANFNYSSNNPFYNSPFTFDGKGCLSIDFDPNKNIWVAGGSNIPNGGGSVYTLAKSINGTTWTDFTNTQNPFNASNSTVYKVIYVNDPTNIYNPEPIWVAVGTNQPNNTISYAWSDNNLNNWTSVVDITSAYSITYLLQHFIIVGAGNVINVSKGNIKNPGNWDNINVPTGTIDFKGYDISNNEIYAVIVGVSKIDTGNGSCIWTLNYNIDLNTFTMYLSNNNPFTGPLRQGNTIAWNGSYWLAGGKSGTDTWTGTIAKSFNGKDWTIITNHPFTGTRSTVTGIRWSGTFWIATGNGTDFSVGMATSYNGEDWLPVLGTSPGNPYNLPYYLNVYNSVSVTNKYYTNDIVGIYSKTTNSESRQITNYYNDGSTAIFNVYPPFSNAIINNIQNDITYTIEIEEFSYDNAYPFVYTGTLIQNSCCYEFELVELILPNYTLSTGNGSKIAFYPFVYVELSTLPTSVANNVIYSNNPHATRILFKVPIYDVQDPNTTPFVRLVSCAMILTIKFNPNESIYFKVLLPNGDVFNTVLPEKYSPEVPNPNVQISALFRYKRVI